MRTVLITGTGSVANSWDPVNRALQSVFPTAPASEANTVFATLVYWLRFDHQDLREAKKAKLADRSYAIRKRMKANRRLYDKLNTEIAEQLRVATRKKHMWLQPAFDTINNRYGLYKDDVTLITTNWDNLLDDKVFCPPEIERKIIYIHGNIDKEGPLYLPSEVATEPYRQNEIHKKRIKLAEQCIGEAERLIIYGLSLSPLDTELGNLLRLAGRVSEVVIIDKSPEEVSRRARWYLSHKDSGADDIDYLILRPLDLPNDPV